MSLKKTLFFLRCRLILFYAYLLGFRFIVAESKEDLDKVYHLRWLVYKEEGYIDPDKYPDERFVDYLDEHSVSFLALHKGESVAAARLVSDSKYDFPTEKLFNIERLKDREKTRELARLAILPKYRGSNSKYGRLAMFGLAFRIYKHSKENSIRYWLINAPEGLARSFERFGARLIRLEEGPLTEENIKAREIIAGYFEKYVLHAYLIDVDNIPVIDK